MSAQVSEDEALGRFAGASGLDRWLFYFEGRAVGGDASDSKSAVAYLEGAVLDIEREIVREIRQALPGEISTEVDIRFAQGSVIWFGMVSVTAPGAGLGGAPRSEGFVLMLERLVCYAIDHVVQEYALHFGFQGSRTRSRGAPHVRTPRATGEAVAARDLSAIEARLDALRRMMRWGFGAIVLLMCAIVLGFALAHGIRARVESPQKPVAAELPAPAGKGPSSPF
jgi:hypothetical protein